MACEKRVLFLTKNMYFFHNWISKDIKKVMICPTEYADSLPQEIQKSFEKIFPICKYFNTSGEVELIASTYHKIKPFTHVISWNYG